MRNLMPISLILALLGAPAAAQSLDGVARLEVLPGWETSTGTHMAGLRVTLAQGWKTYWRAPGDAGIPPMFSWAGSQNIAAAQYHWPTPQVFRQQGMRSIGYHNSLVLPIELTPATDGDAIHMAGEINIGVCQEICVPMTLAFAADLPEGGSRDPAITASLINRPLSATEAGVRDVTCAVGLTDNGVEITATLTVPNSTMGDVVIEAGDPQVWVSEPRVTRSGDQLTATARMVHQSGGSFALDRSAVRITVLGGNDAIDVQGCAAG